MSIFDARFASMCARVRLACQIAKTPGCSWSTLGTLTPKSCASAPSSVEASLKQRHAALRCVSKKLIACLTRCSTRIDAEATERSERFKYEDESWTSAMRKLPVDDIVPSGYGSLIFVLLQGAESAWP